jgi:aspartyl aminopeptidase
MDVLKDNESDVKTLTQRLTFRPKQVWDEVSLEEKKKAFALAEEYKHFLSVAKTEREVVGRIQALAKAKGYIEVAGSERVAGPIMKTFRGKSIALAHPGSESLEEGIRLIVSHIDSPRLDLKQHPLYESEDLAFMKTHYYGGIKKYQWVTRPLAIHGRIVTSEKTLDISVGEEGDDPVFTILDLLPHLSKKVQYDKKLEEAIVGEKLNVLVGAFPFGDRETKERFKLSVLKYLHDTYGLVEEDLISAELEVVPAGRARDVGWDRAFVGGYGQDDRASAFTSLSAMLDMEYSNIPAVLLFVDKEEIGSEGATSAKSQFMESFIADLMSGKGRAPDSQSLRSLLARSKALSADVSCALDPDYKEVHEDRNAARAGYGVCLTKFTGHRGKVGANDADAEYIGWLRQVFNNEGVIWQTGELGKVDEGGGGTVAKFLSVYGMEIIDCGPPVFSMHSPFEILHKGDLYMAYKGFQAFLTTPCNNM